MMARSLSAGASAGRLQVPCLKHAQSPVRRAAFEALEQRRLLSGDGDYVVCDCPMCTGAGAGWMDPNNAEQMALVSGGRASADALPGLPILHSLPSAPAAIYLDFNGYGSYRAFSNDSDYTTFNAQEAADITLAWQRVSTYFAMFNVDVTTEKPTVPFAWQLTSPDTGGVSTVNVFPNNPNNGPRSFNNSSSAVGRTSAYAHEIGHNFGLQHQSAYDELGVRNESGYASGYDAQHGYIMGTDYAHVVRKWVIAHNSTSTGGWNLQSDIDVIAGDLDNYGGDGFRADDYGGTFATATALSVSGVDQVAQGIIERLNDVDMFQFTSTGGRYLVSVAREGESGVDLKLEIYDGGGQLLASEDWRYKNDADIAIDLPAGTYYARIASHGNYGDLGVYNVQVSPIAAGFDSMDVILARRAGTTSWNPATGQWTIVAAGKPEPSPAASATSHTTTFDQLRYAYTQLRGDGEIIALVASDATDSGAYAGLMIRESLADDARFAMVNISPGNNVRFTRRTAAGASHTVTTASGVSGPYWLKLVRTGNVFTAFRSTNGTAWTQVGTAQTVIMGSDVYIGMGALSREEMYSITATFNNVSISGDTGEKIYAANGLAAPANVAVNRGVGSDLLVSWSAVAGATGYLVERSVDGVNFSFAGATAAGVLSLNDPGLEGSARYYYRVFATNGVADARSTASVGANGINRPSAPYGVKTMSSTQNRIVVDWIDIDGETGYRIERSANGGSTWTTIGTVGMNVPSFTDTGVSSATTYQYRIVPLSSFGDGVSSVVVSESTRLPPVNVVATSTANSVTLNWTDLNLGETNYRVLRSTDNTTWSWSTVVTLGGDVTSYTQTGLSSLTRYYYRVQAITSLTESTFNNIPVTTLGAATSLAPWQTADIGDTLDSASTVSLSGSTYTMIANGSDVGTTADDLHFMYQAFTGDVSITVRVAALDGPDGAEVGIMFRSSLADNSPYAMAIITNDADSRFNRRSTVGGTTSSTNGPNMANGNNVVAPYWLRLSRTGNTLLAEQSANGTSWATIGTVSLSLGMTIYAGLALSSQHATTMARATFTDLNVVVPGGGDTTPPEAPVFGNITVDGGVSSTDRITYDTTLILNGTAEPGSTVTLKRGGSTIGTAPAAAGTGAWSFDYTSVVLPNGVATFTATAADAAGNVSPESSMDVTIDNVLPTIDVIQFANAIAHRWELRFSEDVQHSLAPTDFAILNTGNGQSVTPTIVSYDSVSNLLTLGLAGGAFLADGTYLLQVKGNAVSDVAGNVLGARSQMFKVLTGDANSDGTVDFDDLLILAQNYGTSGKNFHQANFNYDPDGKVDFDDLLLLAQKYGSSSLAEDFAAAQAALATPRKPAVPVASVGDTRRKSSAELVFSGNPIA